MYIGFITDDYDSFIVCTDNEEEDINIFVKFLLLSIPTGVLLLSLVSLIIWKTPMNLLTNK